MARQWSIRGRAPTLISAPRDELEAARAVPAMLETTPLSAAEPEAPELAELPAPSIATPMPAPPSDDPVMGRSEHELTIVLGDRRYRVRGWKKPLNPEVGRRHQGVLERWTVPLLDAYTTPDDVIAADQRDDAKLANDCAQRMRVVAAALAIKRLDYAQATMEKWFGAPGARRRYEQVYDCIQQAV